MGKVRQAVVNGSYKTLTSQCVDLFKQVRYNLFNNKITFGAG